MLAMLAFVLAGCSGGGNDDPINPTPKPEEVKAEITIDSSIVSNGLSFGVASGEQTISFSANTNWTLSVASTTSGATWCKASATSGSKGTADVKFTVDENTGYDDRSVSVTIKAGSVSKTFTITQKGADALLVTTNKYEVGQEGGKIEVEVKANINYELAISETAKDWITESKSRALTTYKHTFEIAANEDSQKREGEITFKSGDKVENVKVYQAGSAILLLSHDEFTVSDAGETISVDIKSNVEYGVQMPDVDWITDDATSRGMSSHTLKYIISPNEGYDSRSAEIIFYDKNSDLKDTLKVIQAQKDAIVISQKTYDVKAEGETIEVKLSANVDFEITMPEVDWISQVESRALTEHTLYFKVDENASEEKRSAKIVFTNKDSQLSDEITINQNILPKGSYVNGVVTINTAGTLKRFLGDDYLNITSLKVVGPIHGSDVYVLRQMLGAKTKAEETGKLTTLDLSEATLVKGGYYLDVYWTAEGEIYSSDNIIGAHMFANCPNLQKIILPKDVTSIEICAFSGCDALTSVTLSDNITILKKQAFWSCDALTEIIIPNSVTSIGESAFTYCKALKSVDIGDGVVSIGRDAFDECGTITSLTIGKSLAFIDTGAFYFTSVKAIYIKDLSAWCNIDFADEDAYPGSPSSNFYLNKQIITNLVIPDDVKEIKNFAFYRNRITNVKIGKNVSSIGKQAFDGCSSLSSVTIGDNVTSIGYAAFANCSNLNSVTFGNKVTSIADEAFWKSPVKSLKIPASITSIGSKAFYYANKDECHCYATTPPTLKSQSFHNGAGGKLYVPKGCSEAYESSDWAKFFGTIEDMK